MSASPSRGGFCAQRPIFGADRGHIHHRLLDRGLSPRRVVAAAVRGGRSRRFVRGAASLGPDPFVHPGSAPVLRVRLDFRAQPRLRGVRRGAQSAFWEARVRRLLGAHIHLENLESSLAAAATPNDCWVAIRDACRQLGFHHVRVHLLGETYDERLEPAVAASWTMRIPVSGQRLRQLRPRRSDAACETAGLATLRRFARQPAARKTADAAALGEHRSADRRAGGARRTRRPATAART